MGLGDLNPNGHLPIRLITPKRFLRLRSDSSAAWLTCFSAVALLCRPRFRWTTTKSTTSSGAFLYNWTHLGWALTFSREKGVGSTVDLGPSHAYDNNKSEVLRLLLIILSRQIYVPPASLFTVPSLYTLQFVQRTPRRDVLTVLCSLLNTAMNSSQLYTANSIGGVAGRLPYNHLVFKGEDPRASLVGNCFQVLCALLDFQSGSARDVPTGTGENQFQAPTPRTNAFRYFLAKLVRVLPLLCDGLDDAYTSIEHKIFNSSSMAS